MQLRNSFLNVLNEYPVEKNELFQKNKLANFIRNEIPKLIITAIDPDPRYIIKGSAGQGTWANCPWIGIFDRLITETAQQGFYIVYLFKEDFTGFYISLNQGVTTIRNNYATNTKSALKAKANEYLAKLGSLTSNLINGPIDLASTTTDSLGSDYEVGSICAMYYSAKDIPNDDKLVNDLNRFISLYSMLVDRDNTLFESQISEDENSYTEDLTVFKLHRKVERNKKLASAAKTIHGYKCQACMFDFYEAYGEIGRNYIEAHHLTPLSTLKGHTLKMDPKKDFAVLCSNCHRMIHKTKYVSDIELFKKKLKKV